MIPKSAFMLELMIFMQAVVAAVKEMNLVVTSCTVGVNPKHDSNLTELDGESSGAHLVVRNSQLQLKKLLSDESGFYDGTSSDAPCEWSRGICDHGDNDDESGDGSDYDDWDEDEHSGGLYLELYGRLLHQARDMGWGRVLFRDIVL